MKKLDKDIYDSWKKIVETDEEPEVTDDVIDDEPEGMGEEATVHPPAVGQSGVIVVIEDETTSKVAKVLSLQDNWKLKPIKMYAAYDGNRVSLFTNPNDFIPED